MPARMLDFYPESLRREIDAINDIVYHNINNGVYRAGFATTQSAYDEAFDQLFDAMDELEALLSKQRYLVGEQITEADWRLVYHPGAFRCGILQPLQDQ